MTFKEFLKISEGGGLWAGKPSPVVGRKKPSDGWMSKGKMSYMKKECHQENFGLQELPGIILK